MTNVRQILACKRWAKIRIMIFCELQGVIIISTIVTIILAFCLTQKGVMFPVLIFGSNTGYHSIRRSYFRLREKGKITLNTTSTDFHVHNPPSFLEAVVGIAKRSSRCIRETCQCSRAIPSTLRTEGFCTNFGRRRCRTEN